VYVPANSKTRDPQAEEKRSKLQEGVARPDPGGAAQQGTEVAAEPRGGTAEFVPANAMAARSVPNPPHPTPPHPISSGPSEGGAEFLP
jgi:hypothetical protein